MIGDSTMANKKLSAAPETGWGQVLQQFFSNEVIVSNHAQNGRSSKSFIDEGRWKVVLDSLQPGDYVIIQFGHNDQKTDSARHTDPYTSYKANLEKYVNESRAKGAIPILCTSIVRRLFDEFGNLIDTHCDYPIVTRQVAEEMNVPLIDLQRETEELVTELGPENSKKLYLYTKPGEYTNRAKGIKDDTHLCVYGANEVAKLAVNKMKELKIPLVKYLKSNL
jgi:lysophospholipase L1-like esterase